MKFKVGEQSREVDKRGAEGVFHHGLTIGNNSSHNVLSGSPLFSMVFVSKCINLFSSVRGVLI
jgi:hypothetical protein